MEKQLSSITDFNEYLRKLQKLKNHMVIISVKDTIGFYVGEDNYILLNELGGVSLSKQSELNNSRGYVAIVADSKLLFEKKEEKDMSVQYKSIQNQIELDVFSSPYRSCNMSSIVVNRMEYAVNHRGFNIVVIDIKGNCVVDSVAFDTQVKGDPCYRNYADGQVLGRKPEYRFIRDINSVRERLQMSSVFGNKGRNTSKDLERKSFTKVKVRFFYRGANNLWNCLESVANAFMKDERFDVCIVIKNTSCKVITRIVESKIKFELLPQYDLNP